MSEESGNKNLNIGKQHIVIAIIIGIVCFVAGVQYCQFLLDRETQALEAETGLTEIAAEVPEIMVHVKGAVEHSGVISLSSGSRVVDALHIAGVSDDADLDALNLSRILNDQDEVIVPSLSEGGSVSAAVAGGGDKINLNQASSEQLQSLSGIGPSKAESIIAYRENVGRFNSIEEVKNVSGISDALFDKIKGDIYV